MDLKHYGLFLSISVVGMISVSLSNLFGGNYGVCAAAMIVLSTFLVFVLLDRNLMNVNKLNLSLIGVLVLLEMLFFVTNDIIGYTVYNRDNVGFFGGIVLASQIYSVLLAIYFLIRIVLSFVNFNSFVEVIDNLKTDYTNEEPVKEEVKEPVKEEKKVEIKRIARSTEKKDVPFMEEKL